MAVIDIHILAQAILYFCAVIAGFAIAIPVGVNRTNWQGQCILYSDFVWKNETHFVMMSSRDTNCNFPIYYSVFALIFYGLGTGLYNAYAVIRSTKNPEIGSQMWVMPFILVNTLHAFGTLIVGCMLSVGFMQFCNGLTEKLKERTEKLTKKHEDFSCSFEQNLPWQNTLTGEYYNCGPYYSLMAVAQIAAWSCVLVFLLQVALYVLRFFRNRRRRSAQMFDSAQKSQTSTDTSKITELEPSA